MPSNQQMFESKFILLSYLVLEKRLKVKRRLAGSSTLKLLSLLYPTPEVVPSFISRGATAPSGARALC
jgi:hypothetical protein